MRAPRDFDSAIDRLRSQRAVALAVVEKCDEAIAALGAIEEPRATGVSLKRRVLRMMQADPEKVWSVRGLIDQAEREGAPLEAKEIHGAVRTALTEALNTDHLIVRVGLGRYSWRKSS